MSYQLWDKLLKIIGEYFPDDLVRFVFPDKEIKICGKFEQERIVLEYQIADINFWILDSGVQKLLNIEPYSSWKSSIPGLVFTRNAIITKSLDYKYEVVSVVVLLEKEPCPGSFEVTLGGKVVNLYQFPVVSLKDIEGILAKYRPLAPLVLKVDRSYQDKVITLVKNDKILKAVTVMVLSRLGLKKEEALKMTGSNLAEFRQAFLESPILQDIWQEDTLKANAEGKREYLLKIITKRFKNIPNELLEQVHKVESIERLDEILDLALASKSLKDFTAKMKT